MPKKLTNALSLAKIRAITEPGSYSDGNGLTLLIDQRSNRRWYQRLSVDGKQRNVGLGSYPEVRLSDAREKARVNLLAVQQGLDPVREKARIREERQVLAGIPTFGEAAETYIRLHSPTWKGRNTQRSWEYTIRLANQSIGCKQVGDITGVDITDLLLTRWESTPAIASKMRQRIEAVLDWSTAQGHREGINPAGRHVLKVMPRQTHKTKHHKAVSYAQVPDVLAKVRASTANPAIKLGLEFLALTATRSNEVRGMTWNEVDLDAGLWVIPSGRMKQDREFRVPLSTQALDVLAQARELFGDTNLVFKTGKRGKAIGHATFPTLLSSLDTGTTAHGFRSSLRDFLAEKTGASWAVAEPCLSHVSGTSTERAYARSDYLNLRRPLMQAWSDFLMTEHGCRTID